MRTVYKAPPSPSFPPETSQASLGRRLQRGLTGGSEPQVLRSSLPSRWRSFPSLVINRRLSLPIIAILALLAASLLFLLPGGPLHAQESGTIKYAENGKGAVATYTAVDPEMGMVSWDVEGDDAVDFMIKDGVLSFAEAPDFEAPSGGGDGANSNTYAVTVVACDVTCDDADDARKATKDVTVEVTNEEEEATTKIELSALEPQAGTAITVAYVDGVGNPFVGSDGAANTSIEDPDFAKGTTETDIPADDVKWQWSKSSSRSRTFSDIPGEAAKTATYTPDAQDVNSYLRVTAAYEDAEAEGKSVIATSAYPVRALRSANSDPAFANDFDSEMTGDQPPTAKVNDEATAGSNVGDPITASDANSDRLTYSLEGVSGRAAEADLLQIDRETGQVMVGLGKTVNPISDAGQTPITDHRDTYEVTVKATDPHGQSDTVELTVTVTAVDEAPVYSSGKTSHEYAENGTDAVYPFVAADPEIGTVAYSLSGADAAKFTIPAGALTFGAAPDYEKPGDADKDNVYEVTVRAAATSGQDAIEMSTTLDVMVEVTNEDDQGSVDLSATEPRIGVAIMAIDLMDPDGAVSGLTWQWSTADQANGTYAAVKGATMRSYTPVSENDEEFLKVTAMYTDPHGSGKTAEAAAEFAVQKARSLPPMFRDEDNETDGTQLADREVAESAMAGDSVGDAVAALDTVDADGTDNDDITYSLSGPDGASFAIGSNGQITVGTGADLDFEGDKKTYMMQVNARDRGGLSTSIDLTIKVTNVDEAPELTGSDSEKYAENGKGAVATYTAVDPEMGMVSWDVEGDDAVDFMIKDGVLSFAEAPDFEAPSGGGDGANSNTYAVTVVACDVTCDDADDARKATKDVTVEVTNEEEEATTKIELSALEPQAGTAITVAYVDGVGNPFVGSDGAANTSIEDPDFAKGTTETDIPADDVKWQWSKSSSRSRTFSDIPGEAAKTATYTPDAQDVNSYLRVTAAYEDAEAEGKSVIATSAYPVRALRSANSDPAFANDFDSEMTGDQPPTAKVNDEATAGSNVGDPITASDANSDRLTYSLEGVSGRAAEADLLQIDRETGQVMVGLGKTVNPISDAGQTPITDHRDTYEVTVKATDPHGQSDTVELTVTVTAVDEAPVYSSGKTSHEYAENGTDAVYPFVAADPEIGTVAYSLSGADAAEFTIPAGALTFGAAPDYEKPGDADKDNVYEVTVRAAATSGQDAIEMSTTLDVMVEVTNEDDQGSVDLSATEPRIGVAIMAIDLMDPDGAVSGLTWQWSTADQANGTYAAVKGATMRSYTPVSENDEEFLKVTAMYTDPHGSGKTAEATSGFAAQKARSLPPMFRDEDDETPGTQLADREVAESAMAGDSVGDAVAALDTVDADGTDNDDITYSLSGPDGASFAIGSNGQITVGTGADLDFEGDKKTYMMQVNARDRGGLSTSIDLTIKVTNVDEAPTISVTDVDDAPTNTAPEFPAATAERSVPEKTAANTAIGAPVTATDADTGDTLAYTLGGDDAASFDIDPATGQLKTKATLDFETKTSYSVTVTATDGDAASDTITVTISVTNVDEDGADALLAEYDPNNDDVIEKADMRRAVANYFGPSPTLTKAEMRRLVGIYFS